MASVGAAAAISTQRIRIITPVPPSGFFLMKRRNLLRRFGRLIGLSSNSPVIVSD